MNECLPPKLDENVKFSIEKYILEAKWQLAKEREGKRERTDEREN